MLLTQAHLDCGRYDNAETTLRHTRALRHTRTDASAFLDGKLRQIAAARERHPHPDRSADDDRFPDSADDLFAPLPTAQDLMPDTTTLPPLLQATAALAALDVAAAHSDLPGLADTVITRETRACARIDGVDLDMVDVLTAHLATAHPPGITPTTGQDTLRYLRAAQALIPTAQNPDAAPDTDALARAAAGLAGHATDSEPVGNGVFGPTTRRMLQRLTTWVDHADTVPAVYRLAVAYRRLHTLPLPAPITAPLARLYLTAAATRLAGPTGHRPPLSAWIATHTHQHHRLLATATDRDFTTHLATAITHTSRAEHDLLDGLAAIATDLIGAHTSYDTTTHELLKSLTTLPIFTSASVATRRGTGTRSALDFIARLTARGLIQRIDQPHTRPPGGRRHTHPQALALLTTPPPTPPPHHDGTAHDRHGDPLLATPPPPPPSTVEGNPA